MKTKLLTRTLVLSLLMAKDCSKKKLRQANRCRQSVNYDAGS
jgi:hypothetical protein